MQRENWIVGWVLLLSTFCVTMLVTACEEETKISSSWRDCQICVDGKDHEWQGCPQYYDEKTRTVVSVLNDDAHLYVRLSSNEPEIQRQVLVQGLTVWFEQDGEDKRRIGVHFPVGLPREAGMQMGMGPLPSGPQDPIRELLEKGQREIQLLGPGEYEQKTMPLGEIRNSDIDIKIDKTKRSLVYELKMPITKSQENRHALLLPGKDGFRLGFQTGEMEKEESRLMGHRTPMGDESSEGSMGPGPEEGSGRGRPDMRGGPPGGKHGNPGAEKVEPFEIWLRVALAVKK